VSGPNALLSSIVGLALLGLFVLVGAAYAHLLWDLAEIGWDAMPEAE
jgi:hypothetical protein